LDGLNFAETSVIKQLPTGMFMAAGLVEITPDRDRFRLWNAALPDIVSLSVDPAFATTTRYSSTFPPLGVIDRLDWGAGSGWQTWPEPVRLYLYSDGLVELVDETQEMFGTDRFIERLQQPETLTGELDVVIKQVRRYAVADDLLDDMTLLEISKRQPPLGPTS
jgi:serine phosphatase RsbU (regulator of sigma subunit)